MKRIVVTAIGAGLLTLAALGVAAASATELTRAEYVAQVEPICKANTEANKQIFNGAKGEVKAGKLEAASKRFANAVGAFEKTIKQLEAVPRPAADEAKLNKWLGYLKTESTYLAKIGADLAAGNKAKAQLDSVRLNRNSNLANNTVLAFGFDYCRINPSRFS